MTPVCRALTADRSDQLVSCVIGDGFVSTALREVVKGKRVQERAPAC